jgi:shikimate dehydrogenase
MAVKLKAACVIGWPVEHSRSPLIHGYWIKKHGLNAEYRREPVPPEQFKSFVGSLAERGYVGANVTIPHKEVARTLSKADDRAEKVGAANTLWLDGATLRSTNTDVEGFINNLDAAAPGWNRGLETAVVVGAGGTARAIVYGLSDRGIPRIHVVNRTFERAVGLQEDFGDRVHPVRWEELGGLLSGAGLLVNTTSLGMAGKPPLTINLNRLPPSAVVADVVYAPLETPLLAAARARGLRVVDGLGMLLHQAVRGFDLWFGVRPEVTPELRALVEADLLRDQEATSDPTPSRRKARE